ncbi:MAG: calcium-binding protein [Curvibacter sp.]|nr:MAG: calcium-binding protein [Curvibacter sp.]
MESLVGKLTITLPNNTLATTAKTDFAAFLSLNALSPVVLSTTDTTAIAKLKQANEALAEQWEADSQLTNAQRSQGLASYTENWYADRAAMLSAIATRNQEDATNLIAPNPSRGLVGGRQFRDLTSGTTLTVGTDVPTNQQIVFGSAGDETGASALNGGSQSDRLYGGAGNDTLNGMGGNDYLEGGIGADIYNFSGTFGQDTVVDAGGVGEIRIDGDIIRGGKLLVGSDKLWISDDDKYKFVQQDNGDLVIQRSTGQAMDDSFGRRTERLTVAYRMQTLRMSSTPIVREAKV